jgi:hypothetical protein
MPNPSEAGQYVQVSADGMQGRVDVRVMDMTGRTLYQTFGNDIGTQSVSLNTTLKPGVYIVRLSDAFGHAEQSRLVVK